MMKPTNETWHVSLTEAISRLKKGYAAQGWEPVFEQVAPDSHTGGAYTFARLLFRHGLDMDNVRVTYSQQKHYFPRYGTPDSSVVETSRFPGEWLAKRIGRKEAEAYAATNEAQARA